MDSLLKTDRKSAESEAAFHTHWALELSNSTLPSQDRSWVLAPAWHSAQRGPVHDCQMGARLHAGGGGTACIWRVFQTLQMPTREFSRASHGLGLRGYSWSNPFSIDEETDARERARDLSELTWHVHGQPQKSRLGH